MREKYEVIRIQELDFGCEGMSEDGEVMVYVTLKNQEGIEQCMIHSDALLYARDINVGDKVTIVNNELEKCIKEIIKSYLE